MIEIVILYILNRHDCTAYRIVKLINDLFSPYIKTGMGTISPALKRLEKLNCITFSEKMSDGGMLSKIYSITPAGKKQIAIALELYEFNSPGTILNDAKIALFCSDILSIKELLSFKENLKNYLELYKIKLQKSLENEYNNLNEIQKNTIELTLLQTNGIINLL